MKQAFKADIEKIRERARHKMLDGAVTEAYRADRSQVIDVLQEILATEIVCTLRYRNHYFAASGIEAQAVAAEFKEHAAQEQQHTEWVAERISQLGGLPDFNPKGLESRAHAEYSTGATLEALIREDLVAERVAVETYSEIVRWLGDDDPTTRRLVEDILRQEEEHADDLAGLLEKTRDGIAAVAE